MSKILVAYFSASGVTRSVAEKIAKVTSGDLFEILPVEPYSNGDLNWVNPFSRTTKEKNNPEFRPEIKNKVKDMSEYDTVILGFPVWWYKAPNIVYTFLDENDCTGKTIFPFVTSGGSGVEGSQKKLTEDYPNLSFKDGKRFLLSVDDEAIKKWLQL